MAAFKVPLEVGSSPGGPFVRVEALVDTGATYTLFPRSLLRDLGVRSIERVPFELADDRTVEYEVGEAHLRLDGRERTALVVFGPEGAEPLLGATTLELFNLAIDPVRGQLVPVRALLK